MILGITAAEKYVAAAYGIVFLVVLVYVLIIALKVGRLDLPRRRAVIAESVTVVQGKGFVWSAPKTHSRREVPLPAFLAEQLAPLVEGKAVDDLVFPSVRSGGPIRATHFRRGHFDAAAKAVGLSELHPHELRHTAASLAIASGADVKVVQQMLGHSSATMTLDTYGHLWPDDDDRIRASIDAAYRDQPEQLLVVST